jgi:hypothetical protein
MMRRPCRLPLADPSGRPPRVLDFGPAKERARSRAMTGGRAARRGMLAARTMMRRCLLGLACAGALVLPVAGCCRSHCEPFGEIECGWDSCGIECGGCVDGQCVAGKCHCDHLKCTQANAVRQCCASATMVCFDQDQDGQAECYEPQCAALACGVESGGYLCGTCAPGDQCVRYSTADEGEPCPTPSGEGCNMYGAHHSECVAGG